MVVYGNRVDKFSPVSAIDLGAVRIGISKLPGKKEKSVRNVPAADGGHFPQNMEVKEDVLMSTNGNLTSDPSRGTIFRGVLEHWFSLHEQGGRNSPNDRLAVEPPLR